MSPITRMVITTGILVVPSGVRGSYRWNAHRYQHAALDQLCIQFRVCHGDKIELGPLSLRPDPSWTFDIVIRLFHWLGSRHLCWWRQRRESRHWSGVRLVISMRDIFTILVIRLITIVLLWWIWGIVGSSLVRHRVGFSLFSFGDQIFGLCTFDISLLHPRLYHFFNWNHIQKIFVGVPYYPVIIRRL